MMINQFLDYLRYERNASPQTVQTYEESLRAFESYLTFRDNDLSMDSVDTDLIRDWMESLMDKGNSASTINKNLSALRSFYRFALRRELVKKDPAHAVTGPKKSKPLPQFLREGEMDRLLDGLEWDSSFNNVRARTILLLFYEAGLRRSELIGLDDKDIDFEAAQLKVTGKRNKQRIVPFGAELAEALKNYQAKRQEEFGETSGALFLGDKGERILGGQVYQIVRKYLSMVTSLKKRSPHVLRHTFATAMLNNGAGLETIKSLLGHESVSTTEIYTHTTFEQLKRIYKEAHPRA
ncbi:site-specific tyrosine recombinase/integron integrase [Xylanibacter ruminicola]|uniref:Tyrosine recombinase XerC n=1 Tax=Xylanibacter ruminicola TaxID=839 RepID=A0A1M6U6U6_XYLRU|nr:site-specific tyrosine recombinase/integron integrase [Xylanibacter ruminicola]SHK64890.1 integrase/recombinase XerC [Xylanibacter ruminicola]